MVETIQLLLDQGMTWHEEDDVKYIRRIAKGDAEALRELYAAYGQRMYAYALRLTADPATAEDVVQDSLVAVWQGARRFRGEGRVLSWLLGIVHHKSLNSMRGRSLPVDVEHLEVLPDGDPGPDERVTSQEDAELLRQGIARLSPSHRAILELIFYQGLSLKEVARVCKCPVGTVKSRLSYAKKRLRGILSGQGVSGEDVK
ncbi:MAG: sigma-70 family RNA polymerase sigma factor [Anaerolineae bacterium]|nr:sigma-70 family RNA polymerase sigma factor [Anaerolineae bacterium]